MSTVHIAFPRTLASISAADCIVTFSQQAGATAVASADRQQSGQSETIDQQAIASLDAIARRLGELQEAYTHRNHQLGDQVSQAAAEIARVVLSDQELFQNRALRFVQIALEQIESSASKIAFVHPTCVATIQAWVDSSKLESLSVRGDESVEPGDCHIDCGDTGVAATLDAFLESVLAQGKTFT